MTRQKPTYRGHQSKRIPSWMSEHPIFCSMLQKLHDGHRFSHDPFCALAEFNVLLTKAKKLTSRELSRKASDCIVAKLMIASTALRACRNRHLGSLMFLEHGNLLKSASIHRTLRVLISKDFAKSLRILLVKLLRNVRLRPQDFFGRRVKKTLL